MSDRRIATLSEPVFFLPSLHAFKNFSSGDAALDDRIKESAKAPSFRRTGCGEEMVMLALHGRDADSVKAYIHFRIVWAGDQGFKLKGDDKRVLLIEDLAVDRAFQHNGHARRLIGAAYTHAANVLAQEYPPEDYPGIKLEGIAVLSRPNAVAAYAAMGFDLCTGSTAKCIMLSDEPAIIQKLTARRYASGKPPSCSGSQVTLQL